MNKNFSNLIWVPTKNEQASMAVHGHALYHKITGEIADSKGVQEGIVLEGLIVLIRKFDVEKELVVTIENDTKWLGFYFLLDGFFEFQHSNNTAPVLLTSGTYLPINWSDARGELKVKGQNYCALEVYFSKGFIEVLLGKEYQFGDYFTKLSEGINQKKHLTRISKRLLNSLKGIVNCPYEGNPKISYLECKTRWLLIDLLLGNERYNTPVEISNLPKSDIESIQKVVNYIEQNIKQSLTIKELSEIAGCNTTKLKSNFKQVHATTIFKYITKFRMEKAKTLIIEESFSIAQASYEVGYANPQHFTVAFKKTMGYLPSSLFGKK